MDAIYFDNAATTLQKPERVITAVQNAMRSMANSSRGTYHAALTASEVIYETRERIARLFNAGKAQNVVFTSNATESLNTAINGLFTTSDHVITTAMEHNSVLRPLYRLESSGMDLTIIPANQEGNIDYNDFEKQIRTNTKAIVCTHASNVTGNKNDVQNIGEICRKHRIIFVLDASQTAGVYPIDMKEQHIDVLCFTGHKSLLGPQGTGGLCVKEEISIKPLKVGGSGIDTYARAHPPVMPTALESGTLNGHGIAGLNAGIQYIEEIGMHSIRKKEMELMRRFYNGVKGIPGVKVYGDFADDNRAAIVSLNIRDYDSGMVGDELSDRYGIFVRTGGHCAPLMHKALATDKQGVVRFSFSSFNTLDEIDKGICAIQDLAAE